MIRQLDKLWFRLLGVLYRWALRRGQAHCLREKVRRFRRLMEWQKDHLN